MKIKPNLYRSLIHIHIAIHMHKIFGYNNEVQLNEDMAHHNDAAHHIHNHWDILLFRVVPFSMHEVNTL